MAIVLLCGLIGIALIQLLLGHYRTIMVVLSSLVSIALLGWLVYLLTCVYPYHVGVHFYFSQHVVETTARLMFAATLLVAMLFSMVFICRQADLDRQLPLPEYLALLTFAVFGVLVINFSNSLLTFYLGIELMSLPGYALVAMDRRRANAAEAGIKYFVLGALSTAFLLYGLSFWAGIMHNTLIPELSHQIVIYAKDPLVILGGMLLVIAFAFKLCLFPCQFWVADVYETAPSGAMVWIAGYSKLGALLVANILFQKLLPPLAEYWRPVLMIIALASMVYGHTAALGQKNLRRLMGYSAIGNMGFVAVCFSLANPAAWTAGWYYALGYLLASQAVFAWIAIAYPYASESCDFEQIAGLGLRAPWSTLGLTIALLSMGGLPPLLGFYGKFTIFGQLVQQSQWWALGIMTITSATALFYYLRVIKVFYFEILPLPASTGKAESTIESYPVLAIPFGYQCVWGLQTIALVAIPGILYLLATRFAVV